MSPRPERQLVIQRASANTSSDFETVLRSLPSWFGQEEALLQYDRDAVNLTTFVTETTDGLLGFVTVKQQFTTSFEVHCIAVHAPHRGCGLGSKLIQHA